MTTASHLQGDLPTTSAVARRAARRQARIRKALLACFLVIPLTFWGGSILGFQPSGWAWLLILAVVVPLVITEPLHRRAIRNVAPYLFALGYGIATLTRAMDIAEGIAMLVQLLVPALVYLLAWRVEDNELLLARISRYCLWYAAACVVIAPVLMGTGNSTRPLAISMVVFFVGATVRSKSWRYTVLIGVGCVALAVLTGSRASAAVLLVMLLISPSLNVPPRGRIAMGVAFVIALFAYAQTDAFRERFFFNPEADISSVEDVRRQLNTAGRSNVWPQLLEACSPTAFIGAGLSSSAGLAADISAGTFAQPHNEYIRIYCDLGLPVSIVFWSFFAAALTRSWRGVFRGPDPRLHGAAGQLVAALLLFSLTDNPLVYTAHFMAPAAVIVALSDRALALRQLPVHRETVPA